MPLMKKLSSWNLSNQLKPESPFNREWKNASYDFNWYIFTLFCILEKVSVQIWVLLDDYLAFASETVSLPVL